MPAALTLLLCASLSAADPAPADSLDFASGTLAGWAGEGFYITTGSWKGPSYPSGVSSSDRDEPGRDTPRRTAELHRTFIVPPGAGVLYCTAAAVRPKDCPPDEDNLDIALFAPPKRLIPKQVRISDGWQKVGRLQGLDRGRPREHVWNLAGLAGQPVTLVLVDEDRRPGCHVWCGGFRIIPADVFEPREFSRFMVQLCREQKLPPALRYDSEHFTALSTADGDFTALRLNNCELIYDLFYQHFRRKGFPAYRPPGKLMVAIFDSPAGFEAYLGQKMPDGIVGIYHPKSNRLVVYDLGRNRAFVAMKRQLKEQGKGIGSDMDRIRYIETVNRLAREARTDANISTIMHEVSHQLSFNCGMINRDCDVPAWLAEGLATYCEPTENNSWQGIGEMNPERVQTLAGAQGRHIPLRDLLSTDEWLRKDFQTALIGYAQSWALFRMLIEERPQELRAYMALIYSRKTAEPRFQDFCQIFPDVKRLEVRYEQYMEEVVDEYRRPSEGRTRSPR
jgi:hypothetical protein